MGNLVIELEEYAREKGTYLVQVTCYDEEENEIVPTELKWTLTDDVGAVINARLDQAASPANPTEILLQGADLALLTAADLGKRVLTIKAKYNSSRGTGLPLNDEAVFRIKPLLMVT